MVNEEFLRALWSVRGDYPHGLNLVPSRRWVLVVTEPLSDSFWLSGNGQLLNAIITKGLKIARDKAEVLSAATGAELNAKLASLASYVEPTIILFSRKFFEESLPHNIIRTDDLSVLANSPEAKRRLWQELQAHL